MVSEIARAGVVVGRCCCTCVFKVCKRLIGFTHNIWVAIDVDDGLLPHVEPQNLALPCTTQAAVFPLACFCVRGSQYACSPS